MMNENEPEPKKGIQSDHVLGSSLNRDTNFYQNRHFLRQNGLKFDFGPTSTNES